MRGMKSLEHVCGCRLQRLGAGAAAAGGSGDSAGGGGLRQEIPDRIVAKIDTRLWFWILVLYNI